MGLNNENSARLVFDLETAPLDEAVEYLEPADAPSHYKDPIKIADYIRAEQAKNLERCGLDVDLCRIVAIGTQPERESEVSTVVIPDPAQEAAALTRFWQMTDGRHLIGFNCLAFDLPVLYRRSLYLGVDTPFIQIEKYKHPCVTDLMTVLSFNGAVKMRGLSFYAKRFGMASDDALPGADVALAVKEGRWADVEHHCASDVRKTAAIAARLGCFRLMAELAVS